MSDKIDFGIDQDNIEPTPKWINQLGHDIADRYKLSYVDGILISGMICKAIRMNCSNRSDNKKYDNEPTTLQGTFSGPWPSSADYFASMDRIAQCDNGPKNLDTLEVERKYHAGMTKEQCVEEFIDTARKTPMPYEWDCQPMPFGGVTMTFSPKCSFFFSDEEFKTLCKCFAKAQKEMYAKLNSNQHEG
jgi:hypothetical protein